PPLNPSGVRIGTPAVTSRGMKEPEMKKIGAWIAEVLRNSKDQARIAELRRQVLQLAEEFPLYRWHVPQFRSATLA
ncbi:MAG: serine hydroxymethyltransferase, partial [Acidobacteria bacterium]|nr:serine hydroxymethyltransferase [Acidobacteriota bacterium]